MPNFDLQNKQGELNFVFESKQINKYFIATALAAAKCHFQNVNTRRFWSFAYEKIRSSKKLTANQNFYIKDEDFLNNHPVIKSVKIGTEETMSEIVADIKKNNFYRAFQPNMPFDDTDISIVSAIRREKYRGQTRIRLNQDFINFINTEVNRHGEPVYVPIDKAPLLKCKTNEIYDLFMLLKKWEKAFPETEESKNNRTLGLSKVKEYEEFGLFEITTQAIRNHLHFSGENKLTSTALTRSLKSKCNQINTYGDIQVTIDIIKISNKTAGYHFEITPVKAVKAVKAVDQQSTIDNGVIAQMMLLGIKGKAASSLLLQYSQDELKKALSTAQEKNTAEITKSKLAFLAGILYKQTGKKYVLNN